jgi:hypothetical protein
MYECPIFSLIKIGLHLSPGASDWQVVVDILLNCCDIGFPLHVAGPKSYNNENDEDANDDRDCYEHSSHMYLVAKMFSHRTTDAIDSLYS